jgi:hypothetical protein
LFHLVLESHDGRALCADSEEKREPASDIDTAAADSLKVLDPKWPIREADIRFERTRHAEGRALIKDTGLIREFSPLVGNTMEARP